MEHRPSSSRQNTKTAIVAGGCFWCVEAVFQRVRGVVSVESGYVWMTQALPSVEDTHRSPHSRMEAVRLVWDPAQVSLVNLLDVFYATSSAGLVDWTNPAGMSRFRSGVFLDDPDDIEAALAHREGVTVDPEDGGPVKTQILPLPFFRAAEPLERNFYQRNPKDGFCRSIIEPKLKKLLRCFPDIVRASPSSG